MRQSLKCNILSGEKYGVFKVHFVLHMEKRCCKNIDAPFCAAHFKQQVFSIDLVLFYDIMTCFVMFFSVTKDVDDILWITIKIMGF